jgi:hypothetical protein
MESNLIINGIDFNKRIEDAKRLMHISIEWKAQVLGIAKYFNVKLIEERDEQLETFKEIINRLREKPLDPMLINETPEDRQAKIDVYVKHMEQYLLTTPLRIHFELERI